MLHIHNKYLELKCQSCGLVWGRNVKCHRVSSQIYEFIVREKGLDESTLSPGEIYEGQSDRYCEGCLCSRAQAQARATFNVLAEYINNGQAMIKAKYSAATITATQLRD